MPRERTQDIDKRLWSTPQSFYDRLDRVFGFTIDLAAEESTAKHERYYAEEKDSLAQDWSKEVGFGNFPYGNEVLPCKPSCNRKLCEVRGFHDSEKYVPGLSAWLKKAYLESLRGATVVGLIPASWSSRYWHDFVMKAEMLIIVEGRLKFLMNGKEAKSPDFDSIVAVWTTPVGRDPQDFPRLLSMKAYV